MGIPFYAVIMAGGSGTRLWPLSRRKNPKQLLRLSGERTLYQLAIDRLDPIFAPENIIVITAGDMVSKLMEQSPNIPVQNFLVEPEGRGTAPVIGLGAFYAEHLAGGEAVIACLTADHLITDVSGFQKVLIEASEIAFTGSIVTLGIEPTFPSTGYGYIQRGRSRKTSIKSAIFDVKRFKEKPNEFAAGTMSTDGEHSWNSGMFVWSTRTVQSEFRKQIPETFAVLEELVESISSDLQGDALSRIWPTIPKDSIDYAIMENAKDVCVIPINIGWSDVGSWLSVLNTSDPDGLGNVLLGGMHHAIDTANTLVSSSKLVATIGVENLIIIDTPDVLLVCDSNRSEDVKRVVEALEDDNKLSVL